MKRAPDGPPEDDGPGPFGPIGPGEWGTYLVVLAFAAASAARVESANWFLACFIAYMVGTVAGRLW